MNLVLLASLIIVGSLIRAASRKHTKATENANTAFWNKEMKANSVRKKSLDDLDYITIPMETLPFHIMTEDEKVQEYTSIIKELSTSKIVNFNGISNTDLKLTYGTANITVLSSYDENYSTLIGTLQRWANLLYDGGYLEDACTLLEYAVSIKSDIRATYFLLADIYKSRGASDKIMELYGKATELESNQRKIIVHTLQESYL